MNFGPPEPAATIRVMLNGRAVAVTVEGADGAAAARASAAALVVAQQGFALRSFCADRLLDDRNAAWIDGPGDAVDRATFMLRLVVRAIGVRAGGALEVTYGDGGLFRGHDLVVSTDAHGVPTGVDLAG
jgi:hypothetical protein